MDLLRRFVDRAASGNALFMKGLRKAHSGHDRVALKLFDEAAQKYRKEEAVEKLARLRAHQLMVKYKTETSAAERQSIIEEVVLRLSKLAKIESPEPPHALADAKEVLRNWMEDKTLFIGVSDTENQARLEEETILAELESALPCELIGLPDFTEEREEVGQLG